jgi:hypothetical protein
MFAILMCLLLVSLGVPSTAQAQYLDPGAGSLVVQLVIAGLVGAGALLRIYWRKLTALFRRVRGSSD